MTENKIKLLLACVATRLKNPNLKKGEIEDVMHYLKEIEQEKGKHYTELYLPLQACRTIDGKYREYKIGDILQWN